MLTLVIGNRNYSSWSLRAWLFLHESGIRFEEVRLDLFTESWRSDIAAYSPAARVPVLLDGSVQVWDSLAIMQYLHERFPDSVGWPGERPARAHALSITAEMHSGFLAIRNELPQNIKRQASPPERELSADCLSQIDRITGIWADCHKRYGESGPWLFGKFSIADAMYAPVALRFRSYGIAVPSPAEKFMESISALPAIREWCAAAADESESVPFIDQLIPAEESPLTLV